MENIETTLPIFISVIALVVSVFVVILGWWRHRNVYDIERTLFFRKNQIENIPAERCYILRNLQLLSIR